MREHVRQADHERPHSNDGAKAPPATRGVRPLASSEEHFLINLQRLAGNAAVAQHLTGAAALPPEMTAPYVGGEMSKAYLGLAPAERTKVNAATDARFLALTGIARRLNFKTPGDRPAARMWLRLRDEEMLKSGVLVTIGIPTIVPSTGGTATTFTNPVIQKIFEENKSTGTPSQLAALHILDQKRSGPWSKLQWDDVAAGAARRVYNPVLIDQKVLGVCGSAAALEGEAATQAAAYAQEVADVFQTGKAAGTKVNAKLLGTTPSKVMDASDWMMLTAMQDVANYILEYHGEEDSWRAGLTDGQIEFSLKNFAGCVKTTKYTCSMWGVLDQTVTINGLMSTYGDDVVVVMIVSADVLQGTKDSGSADHAIRLVSPVTLGKGTVTFNVFTWGPGYSGPRTVSEKRFKKMVFSYIVGARKETVAFP